MAYHIEIFFMEIGVTRHITFSVNIVGFCFVFCFFFTICLSMPFLLDINYRYWTGKGWWIFNVSWRFGGGGPLNYFSLLAKSREEKRWSWLHSSKMVTDRVC